MVQYTIQLLRHPLQLHRTLFIGEKVGGVVRGWFGCTVHVSIHARVSEQSAETRTPPTW